MVEGLTKGSDSDMRRQLDRKAAGLQNAALYVLGARAQVRVAEIDVAPGIDDGDHRLAGEIVRVIAALAQARTVAEGAQVVDAEPAVAAQVLRGFAVGHSAAISGLMAASRNARSAMSCVTITINTKAAPMRSLVTPGLISSRPPTISIGRCQ